MCAGIWENMLVNLGGVSTTHVKFRGGWATQIIKIPIHEPVGMECNKVVFTVHKNVHNLTANDGRPQENLSGFPTIDSSKETNNVLLNTEYQSAPLQPKQHWGYLQIMTQKCGNFEFAAKILPG